MMTYSEALCYIHDSKKWKGPKRKLSRTKELLAELGSPEKKLKFVHVAGTNGKGSTCALIESILRHAGYKTGMFTSPYISRFNERIRLNGEDISDGDLAEVVSELQPYADALSDSPTEFEIVTVLGMMYFAKKECDVVVLEVGLGGENDFTNVIDTPDAAVITTIGFDHTKQLGPTLADIACAKAGIIKPGGDVVIYGGVPEADAVFEERCREKGAVLNRTQMDKVIFQGSDLTSCTFSFGEYKNLTIPLAGTYQPYNAAVAITAAEVLRKKGYHITDDAIVSGVSNVCWKGRFELLRRHPDFILDGAHNPPAVEATAKSIREKFGGKKVVILTGVMADKDIKSMIPHLAPLAECFVTVAVDYPRALPAEAYAELLRSYGLTAEAAGSIPEGVRRAAELAGEDGAVCALGSLYLSQDIREAVEKL